MAGIHNMMRQRAMLFEQLEVAEAMRAFISHRLDSTEELRVKLEQVEADLAAAQKAVADGAETLKLVERENGAIHAKADRLKEKEETMEAKFKGAEQEN